MKKSDHLTMNVYWFGLAFMWNALHPIILPALLIHMVPDALKNTALGSMTFAGLVLAMIIQPLAGSMSDGTESRWGRRRPWMAVGTALSLVFLGWMAAARSFLGLVAGYLLLQIVSNSAHGPAQGLIPDLVPEREHGIASGVKNLFDMLGLVVASLVAGNLISEDSPTAPYAFAAIGGVLAISTLVTLLTTREVPRIELETAIPAPGYEEEPQESAPRRLLAVDLSRYPDFAWLLVSRFLILLGIYSVQGFAQYYIGDVLQVQEPAQVTGNLMATIGLPLTLMVVPAGLLADRIGRKRLNLIACLILIPSLLLLILARSVPILLVFGSLIGLGTGIFVSANWALATELIPKKEAGKYLGFTNLATAGASAVSRLAGPLIDGGNALHPGAYLGYTVLFILASTSAFLGTLLLSRIKAGARRPRPAPAR